MNLQLPGGVRKGRLAATFAAALLAVSVLPAAPVAVVLGATTIQPATGGRHQG